MNNKFKYSPLAIMIASALSISGCGGGDNGSALVSTSGDSALESTSSNIIPTSNIVEANADTAHVKLAVKFPQADAAAAWVGDSKSIEVSFFNTTTVGSIAEANAAYDAQCVEYIDWQNHCNVVSSDVLRGQFATSVFMDTDAPSAFVDLLPGKYRIEAKFSNAQGKHQETSVSYVTLSKGEHSLKLRGLEATWTATEQLTLQLLNQTTEFDWDPDSEGIQSAAEKIGITGAITGLHLPTVLTYPDGYLHANDGDQEGQAHNQAAQINAGVTNIEQLDREAQATAFQPVLRIAAAEGEYNLLPRFLISNEENRDEQGNFIGVSGSWNNTGVATLQQEYNSEGDNASLNLGGYYMGYWDHDGQTYLSTNHAVSLEFGTRSLPDAAQAEPAYTIMHSYPVNGQNEGEQLTIARINMDSINDDSEVGDNWQQLFVDLQGTPNQVVDGSTITGFLIETETHYTRVWGNEWSNTGVDTQPASFLEAALVNIAETEGLMATGAAAETCKTQAISGLAYSNDYLWDEAQQGWIAGTYNEFLSEDGLISQIDNRTAEQTMQRDSAQSDLGASQAELDMYNAEIVAIVEAQMAPITTTINAIDTIISDNSALIADYKAAVADTVIQEVTLISSAGAESKITAETVVSEWSTGSAIDAESTYQGLNAWTITAAQDSWGTVLALTGGFDDDFSEFDKLKLKIATSGGYDEYRIKIGANGVEHDDIILSVNDALISWQDIELDLAGYDLSSIEFIAVFGIGGTAEVSKIHIADLALVDTVDPVVDPVDPTDQVVNGDFANDTASWDGVFTVTNGVANLKVEGMGDGYIKQTAIGMEKFTAGETLTLSYDIKGTATVGSVFSVIIHSISEGVSDVHVPEGVAVSSEWQTVTRTFTAGSPLNGGLDLTMGPVCGPVDGCEMDVEIDNISITSADTEQQAPEDELYIKYQVVEQEVYDLIAPYDIYVPWGSSVFEVASAALQTRNNQLQTTLDEIASNSELTNADYNDNWELYNNRWNALWPVTYALATIASANDTLTQLAQLKADALATADLNGDGEATLFEAGVYLATGSLYGWVNQDYSWDDATGQEIINYYLELGDFVIKDTVKATSMEGEQTICVQPFTLKASQLSIEFDTTADILIE